MKKFDLKQNIKAFLLKEDGRITKKSILKAGIVLGAMAIAVKSANAEWKKDTDYHQSYSKQTGDCEAVAQVTTKWPDYPGTAHENVAHDNLLNVKNFFGRLVLGHDNCIETHRNHYSYYHDEHDSSD